MTLILAIAILFVFAAPAAILSLALCGVMERYGPRDVPDGGRKTQAQATPTAGGVGFLIAALAGVLMLAAADASLFELPAGGAMLPMLIMIAGAVVLGLIDDVADLPVIPRLAALAGLSLFGAAFSLPDIPLHGPTGHAVMLPTVLSVAGAALFIFVMTNAVNFMDGANGFVASALLPAFAALALYPVLAVPDFYDALWTTPLPTALAATALAGALVGFLAWNASGRLFMGDAGALGLGAAFAGLSCLCVAIYSSGATRVSVWFPATLALPILVDVFMTLVWRFRQGEELMEAHRDHAYQLFLRDDWPHAMVAGLWARLASVCAVAGLIAALAGPLWSFWVFIALLAVGVWLWVRQRRLYFPDGA
ncbi:MAG: hypothetical protein AAFY37_15270 [Pseudomonadota bacterium]